MWIPNRSQSPPERRLSGRGERTVPARGRHGSLERREATGSLPLLHAPDDDAPGRGRRVAPLVGGDLLRQHRAEWQGFPTAPLRASRRDAGGEPSWSAPSMSESAAKLRERRRSVRRRRGPWPSGRGLRRGTGRGLPFVHRARARERSRARCGRISSSASRLASARRSAGAPRAIRSSARRAGRRQRKRARFGRFRAITAPRARLGREQARPYPAQAPPNPLPRLDAREQNATKAPELPAAHERRLGQERREGSEREHREVQGATRTRGRDGRALARLRRRGFLARHRGAPGSPRRRSRAALARARPRSTRT